MRFDLISFSLLAFLPSLALAQTAGTQPPLIYTRDPAQTAPSSLIAAIATAAAPASAVGNQAPSPATLLIAPMATTATVGPVTRLGAPTGSVSFVAASP